METQEGSSSEESHVEVVGLSAELLMTATGACVGLIGLPAEPDTLHATLRLALRLTRDYRLASQFSSLGGLRLLLGLEQSSSFSGFISLATLLIRHVLEDECVLAFTMEKVLRSSCAGTGSHACGVGQDSIGSKEMHYVLRVLAPAAARHPDLFLQIAKKTLRIALPLPAKRGQSQPLLSFQSHSLTLTFDLADDLEAILTNPSAPQLLKCVPSKASSNPQGVSFHGHEVLTDLLKALIAPFEPHNDDGGC